MEAFNYYNPTRLINGKDKQQEIGNILQEDGIEHVLLVYGKSSIKRSGLYDELVSILKDKDTETLAIDNYNKKTSEDSRVENLLIGIRDGLMISRKIK